MLLVGTMVAPADVSVKPYPTTANVMIMVNGRKNATNDFTWVSHLLSKSLLPPPQPSLVDPLARYFQAPVLFTQNLDCLGDNNQAHEHKVDVFLGRACLEFRDFKQMTKVPL